MFHRIPGRWPAWLVATIAYPIAGLAGYAVAGPVDGPVPGLVAGLVAGVVVGVAQVVAAGERDRRVAGSWIAATAIGLGLGAAFGSGLGLALPVTGVVAGGAIGVGQWLAAGTPDGRLVAWPVVTAAAWGIGWVVTTAIGVDPAAGWAVFGVSGALVAQTLTLVGARVLRAPVGVVVA
jgi:hypothetical protein